MEIEYKKTLNLNGECIDLSTPIAMGILNITPDSFYDGGKLKTEKAILEKAEKMLSEGATILDIGGASSKPGATEVTENEEISRILPSIKAIVKYFPEVKISIDTFRSEIAKIAVAEGACMINDISGGELDKNMFSEVSKLKVPYVCMHMKGTPQNMQQNTHYEDIIKEIYTYFSHKIYALTQLGINNVIIDLGFGFSKNIEQNFGILKNLSYFDNLDKVILVGISRKSMIYNTLGVSPNESLNGTTALNMVALQNGASILRVHDVKEAVETIKLYKKLTK